MLAMHLSCHEAKRHNLKLKTLPKQLLGYLPLAFALRNISMYSFGFKQSKNEEGFQREKIFEVLSLSCE
jgi:hypothetical protein